jgi:hypothetical protein
MTCSKIQKNFSSYLDGAVNGSEMHAINAHLETCDACRRDYNGLRNTQVLLAAAGRRKAPPELALQLRVAVSRERARTSQDHWQGFQVRFQNAFDAFMLPATAGLVTAVLIFGILINFLVPVQAASSNDVPTMLYIPPRLAMAPYGLDRADGNDSPVVIETYVDANGRVQDYRILSGDDSGSMRSQLNQALIFTIFEPAQAFGRKVPGRVVLSFSSVRVRG